MSKSSKVTRQLTPLAYHNDAVRYLKDHEPVVWSWARSQKVRTDQIEQVRATTLRETYRLEPDAHGAIHDSCHEAMSRLEIDAPVSLYQSGGAVMNAALCFVPGEIHIVFMGPIIEKLHPPEILALLGHELSHYKLWSAEEGTYHTASTIFDLALTYPEAAASHVETHRLLSLYTELYADRGAAIACSDPEAAITCLLKTSTGIQNPNAAAYLRQAEEIEANPTPSQGVSHPEIFLRARAVDRWWNNDKNIDDWINQRLLGPLSLTSLDVTRQIEATELTKRYFRFLLASQTLRTDAALTQIRSIFTDWQIEGASLSRDDFKSLKTDQSFREYFSALTFDVAMCDMEIKDEILETGANAAAYLDGLDEYKAAMRRDLKLSRQVVDRLTASAAKISKREHPPLAGGLK
jgi:Peptidase family M48